ncbi:30S ribosomal protein 2 [Nymphaea thermarum]|nr:30S ribosomal protein 2 [Nymphaea thermarum]
MFRFPSCGRVFYGGLSRSVNPARGMTLRVVAEAQQTLASTEATRRLYVGNIPRNIDNEELTRLFQKHGSVEKAEVKNS